MSKYHYSNAHFYKDVVDNDTREQRIDLRLRPENQNFRTNIRDRWGNRSYINEDEFLNGTMYRGLRKCVRCHEEKQLCEFENLAIHEANRALNGFNIICRTCHRNDYSHGYKVDGFISSQDDLTMDLEKNDIEYRDNEKSNRLEFDTSSDDEDDDSNEEELSSDDDSDYEEDESDEDLRSDEEYDDTNDSVKVDSDHSSDEDYIEDEEDLRSNPDTSYPVFIPFHHNHILFDDDDEKEKDIPQRVEIINERHLVFHDSDEEELTPLPYQVQLDSDNDSENDSMDTISQHDNNDHDTPDLLIDGEPYYIVEKILDHMYDYDKKEYVYLIKWENFDTTYNSWEPADCLHPELLQEYHEQIQFY